MFNGKNAEKASRRALEYIAITALQSALVALLAEKGPHTFSQIFEAFENPPADVQEDVFCCMLIMTRVGAVTDAVQYGTEEHVFTLTDRAARLYKLRDEVGK